MLLRSRLESESIDELLRNPLTASLCLLVARQKGNLPRSRAGLYLQIVQFVSERWAALRAGASSPPQQSAWPAVAPAIERLALQMLSSRRSGISIEELEAELRPSHEYEVASAIDLVTRRLGLLVRRPDGSYDFIFRGLAEHFAARYLIKQPDATARIIAVAESSWGQEIVRHAIGLADERLETKQMVSDVLRRLVARNEPIDLLTWLRRILAAGRASVDIRELDDSIADQIGESLYAALAEEESAWFGERMVPVVKEVSRRRGRVCAAFLAQAGPQLNRRVSPAAWMFKRADRTVEYSLRELQHRDAAVRSVVVRRLEAHKDRPDVRFALLQTLFEHDSNHLGGQAPALTAALVLRRATRDADFEHLRSELLNVIDMESQLASGAAATALRPGEADIRKLVAALRYMGTGYPVPPEPLQDILAMENGAAVLDEMWPEWRTRQETETIDYAQMETDDEGVAPPSRVVRRRIMSGLQPIIHQLGDQISAWDSSTRFFICTALCESALEFPEVAVQRLGSLNWDGAFVEDCQVALARAAAAHEVVARALLDRWDEIRQQPDHLRAMFPGRALEPLIKSGNEEAANVYAEWLPHSSASQGWSYFEMDPVVLAVPIIAAAARKVVLGVWRFATRGRTRRKEKQRLSPIPAGTLLNCSREVWKNDEELRRGVLRWVRDKNPLRTSGGLAALEGLSLRDDERDEIVKAMRWHLQNPPSDFWNQTGAWIGWIANAELTVHLEREIAQLVNGQPMMIGLRAAAALVEVIDEKNAEVLSSAIAPGAVVSSAYDISTEQLRTLVVRAPDAWLAAACAQIQETLPINVRWAVRLLGVLDYDRQRVLADAISATAGNWELPWVEDLSMKYAERPADLARMVLFDMGWSRRGG